MESGREGVDMRNSSVAAALDEARTAYAGRNPASRAQHEAARAALPGGNTRTVLYYEPFPVAFARGQGARLVDLDGHEYVDFLSEFTAGVAGHSHPAIRAAVAAAMDAGINLGGHNTLEPRFAAAVQARFPSMQLLRFTNSGTEANLMALSLAIAATGRRKVMVFPGGYHGAVLTFAPGASMNVPFDYVQGAYNDIGATLAVVDAHRDELAAAIVEPMLGGGGCLPAEHRFLIELRQATEAAGTVLVFDEVMTSRLAPGGLQSVAGVVPDLTTLGKYVGGGMSFGAFGGRRDLMERLDPSRPGALPHAGTFNNNVLTMAAGLAALTEVFPPEACVAMNALGDTLRERLNQAAGDVPLQFTGIGSMLTAHVMAGKLRTPADVAQSDVAARDLLFFDLMAAGLWIARRGMVALSVCVTPQDCDRLVAAVEEYATVRGPLLH